jgi:hypothetical protein
MQSPYLLLKKPELEVATEEAWFKGRVGSRLRMCRQPEFGSNQQTVQAVQGKTLFVGCVADEVLLPEMQAKHMTNSVLASACSGSSAHL